MRQYYAAALKRNRSLESQSEMKKGRLGLRPVTSAAFPEWDQGSVHQNERGTSIRWDVDAMTTVKNGGAGRESIV